MVSYHLFHRGRVSLFHRKTARAASCMRAGPSDFRRRSRSVVRPGGDVGERLNEAQAKYERILAEGRAGTRYQSCVSDFGNS